LLAVSLKTAHGQAVSGTITGVVTDPAAAAVAGAIVTITEVNKGVEFMVQTNESGFYTRTQLPPGTYKVRIEAPGFKAFERNNIMLSVDTSVRLDATLQVGQISDVVVVTDSTPLLRTERAEVATVVPNTLVTDVPILGRNFTALQLLVPGTTRNPWQHGAAENPQGGLQINANGQLFGAMSMQIDGADNNDPVLGIVIINPPIDSVREFKTTTSNYDAEFGRVGAGLTQVETKSGTNEFHGSLFHFIRNDVLNARNPFTEPTEPPPLRWNQFGGSVGGPIIENHLFFFGDYQGKRERRGSTVFATVPTARMRAGDFSELPVQLFDPTTGNPDGTGRQPFPGNIIPTNRINPAAQNLLNLLPLPTFSDRIENNFIASGSTKYDTDQFDIRIDPYITDATRFFGRYNFFNSDIFVPPVFGTQAGGMPIQSGTVGGFSEGRNQNAVINFNHVFTPALLLDARYAYSRYRVNVRQPDVGLNLANQVGIPNINLGGLDTSGLPTIRVQGVAGFDLGGGRACNCPLDQVENLNQAAANMAYARGRHNTKFGADVRRFWNFRRPSDISRRGDFTFTPAVTGSADVPGSGAGVASLLLGSPSSFSRVWSQGRNDEFETHLFFYGQDQWKVTRKLAVSYGLRYEIYTPPEARRGQGSNFDFASGLVRIAGLGNISKDTGIVTDWNNLAPRIGIAYLATPKTVVRAGYGRSYFPNIFAITISGQNFPFVTFQNILSPGSTFTPLPFTLSQGPPLFTFPPLPANGLLPLPNGIQITGIPFDRTTAYTDNWNLTIQQEILPSLAFEIGYVGNVGRQLRFDLNLNQAFPGPGALDPRRPFFQGFGLTQQLINRCNCSSSNYNGLQAKLEKRLSAGLAFIAAYTFSKAINFGEFGTEFSAHDLQSNRGPAFFDRTHVFTVGHAWELPFGPGMPFLSDVTGGARLLVQGWEFSGFTTVQSGRPFTPTLSNNATLNADFTLRPDLVGNPDVSDPNRTLWFNPSAFAIPGQFRQGTAGRNILRGPRLFSADWGLFKNFYITEQAKLQFRWEVFNSFNYTNLTTPSTNVDTPSAGQIFGLEVPPREMQFGLRLAW
jgi:hypothetical protein